MSFSQTGILDVSVRADGPDLFVSWTTSLPGRPTYQVYVDRRLAWSGRTTHCHVPAASDGHGRNLWVEVGAVGPGEARSDFSADLPDPGARAECARLSWKGGTYLDPTGADDLVGFRIYQSPAPGEAVDLSQPSDFVPAYPFGRILDGFGKGGFGGGGFGRAETSYFWQSPPLASGTWTFQVQPVGRHGALPAATPATATVAILAAPRPPAPDVDGRRLRIDYGGPSATTATLRWLPSPSA